MTDSRPSEVREAIADYLEESKSPWAVLLFLLPAVLYYEIRLAVLVARGEEVLVNKAEHGVLRFLDSIGLGSAGALGMALPGVVLVAILLLWHLLLRARWRVAPATLIWMLAESAIMTLPLLALSKLASGPGLFAAAEEIRTIGATGKLAVSLGAGIFEELVFRLLLLAALHALCCDVLRLREWSGSVIAVVVAAVLFAVYHPIRDAAGELDLARFGFYLLAGVWLGVLMLRRGFGITVGAHALYDVAVLLGGP